MVIDIMSFEMVIDNKYYNSNFELNCFMNMSYGMRVDFSSFENVSIKDCCNILECICLLGGCIYVFVFIVFMMIV